MEGRREGGGQSPIVGSVSRATLSGRLRMQTQRRNFQAPTGRGWNGDQRIREQGWDRYSSGRSHRRSQFTFRKGRCPGRCRGCRSVGVVVLASGLSEVASESARRGKGGGDVPPLAFHPYMPRVYLELVTTQSQCQRKMNVPYQ
ncbi:hypothetical protein BC832DRAFT_560835 [Gaertneriomyces semiglobifer]|nr:hypothetical protein BC832DRAFT_560835 [Gaertneriomyces semiglobifer]